MARFLPTEIKIRIERALKHHGLRAVAVQKVRGGSELYLSFASATGRTSTTVPVVGGLIETDQVAAAIRACRGEAAVAAFRAGGVR